MIKTTRAFVSCRFHRDDMVIIRWFERKLRSLGLQPHTAMAPRSIPPPEKVLADITSSDVVVAIVTKTPSPWIQNEIGMAYALGKPVVAFFEAGAYNKGLYPYVADYLEFSRRELESATDPTIHLINDVVRRLDAHASSSAVYGGPVRLLSQTEIQELLPGEIAKSNTMQLVTCTAETFLNDKCHAALKANRALKAQLLIRHPQSDPRKREMAETSLVFLDRLAHPGIEVKLYRHAPILRALVFDGNRGFLGLYRWDPGSHFQYVGAENNALAAVTRNDAFGSLWLDLYLSRFDCEWKALDLRPNSRLPRPRARRARG
jgi:hypothetical protein